MKSKLKIKGLDCANCALDLERTIQKVEGVKAATISFMAESLQIEYDESQKEKIMQEVKQVIKKEEPDVTIEEV